MSLLVFLYEPTGGLSAPASAVEEARESSACAPNILGPPDTHIARVILHYVHLVLTTVFYLLDSIECQCYNHPSSASGKTTADGDSTVPARIALLSIL